MKDKQTLAVITEGEKLQSMTNGDGWKIAKRILTNKLMDAGSILGLSATNKTKDSLIQEIGARQLAVEIVYSWIEEVEGRVAQHKSHGDIFKDIKNEEIIKYFGE